MERERIGTYADSGIVLVPGQNTTRNSVRALKIGLYLVSVSIRGILTTQALDECSTYPDAVGASLDFGFFMENDGSNRMQGNRIPDQLKTMLVPFLQFALPLQEVSGSIGTVDLEPLVVAQDMAVRRMANWEARVMQDRSNCMCLSITILGMRQLVGDDEAQQEASNDVVVGRVGGHAAGEAEGGVDKGRVGDGHTAYDLVLVGGGGGRCRRGHRCCCTTASGLIRGCCAQGPSCS